MATPHSTPQPSPVLFFDTMRAYQRTAALKSAVELDLFTAVGEGNTTADAAARRFRSSGQHAIPPSFFQVLISRK